jgi:hypothetical protein
MLEFLHGRTSDRKLRLFAVACCRRLAHFPGDAGAALAVAERFADRLATDADRSAARKDAQRAAQGRGVTRAPTAPKWERRAASAVYYAAARDAGEAAWNARQLVVESLIWWAGGYGVCDARAVQEGEHRPHAELARDIFGNPFRPVAADAGWRASTVIGLARQVYELGDFSPMPVLADALQDAGCDDGDVLNHCRGDGPHVRGCWVVDLVPGKG